MTRLEFSTKILRCSSTHWSFVLRGERNLAYKRAKLVSDLFGTNLETWIDPTRAYERIAAWRKFSGEEEKK